MKNNIYSTSSLVGSCANSVKEVCKCFSIKEGNSCLIFKFCAVYSHSANVILVKIPLKSLDLH